MGATLKERIDVVVRDAAEAAARTAIQFAVDGFREIYSSIIDDYYASYSPHYYNREGDMYRLINIDISDDGIYLNISFDETLLKYRNDTPTSGTYDGLYTYAFHEGWHGGAASGPNHPDEGTPYWRNPKTGFRTWLKEAFRSESPYDRVDSEFNQYWNTVVQGVFNDEFHRELASRQSEINQALVGVLSNG